MDETWLNRHRQSLQLFSLAAICLSLGFIAGSQVSKSVGDAAMARSDATVARAEKITRECIDMMQGMAKRPPATPVPDTKPN